MKRREVLKTLGAAAGAMGAAQVLPGCGDDVPGLPPGIHNIVVVMMENRSYDHLLGARSFEGKPGDGLRMDMTNPDMAGQPVGIYKADPARVCVPDPPHGWNPAHAQWGMGMNQGFVIEHQRAHDNMPFTHPMQYLDRSWVPVTWALADAYTTCDRWFCSVMGPTWPNRMYWHSGSSNGIKSNELPTGGFNWPSIHHRMDDKGVPWRYYYTDLPVLGIVDSIDKVGRMLDIYEFLNDAKLGRLQPLSYVDPGFALNDDHPPHHPWLGQQFLSAIYTALATSPQWEHTLLVVTYDEHGGFFDHVSPPTVSTDGFAAEGFNQLGFRVPATIIGPYARAGHVSSVVREHSSMLRHVEQHFGLEPCNARTAGAADLSETLDQAALAAGTPGAPITLPAVEIDESMIGAECRGSLKPSHDVIAMADRYPHLFAAHDLRKRGRDAIYDLGEYLDQHGLGRIRRGR